MGRAGLVCVMSWLALIGLGGAVANAGGGPDWPMVALAATGQPAAARPGGTPLVALVSSPFGAAWRSAHSGRDRTTGRPVEIGGDRVRRFIYRDTFDEPLFLTDASIDGLHCVRWDSESKSLILAGRSAERERVSLTYRFTAPYDAKELVAEAEGAIEGSTRDRVELSLSLDGKRFVLPARAFGRVGGNAFCLTTTASYRFDGPRGFWLRVTAELGPGSRVVLRRIEVNCRVKPPGRPEVMLVPDIEGRLCYTDTFASSRILHLAQVYPKRDLLWRRGCVFITGKPGAPAEVTIRQKFISPEPLRRVVVRVRHAVNRRELGGSTSVALSVDGRTPLVSRRFPGPEGIYSGVTELKLDSPGVLASARSFYLHITLGNDGRAQGPSNVIAGIEVEALPAERGTATAAATRTPTR